MSCRAWRRSTSQLILLFAVPGIVEWIDNFFHFLLCAGAALFIKNNLRVAISLYYFDFAAAIMNLLVLNNQRALVGYIH